MNPVHPAAWWLWALGMAAAATRTTNPLLLALVITVVSVTVAVRRTDAPWALSFRLYLVLGAVVVGVRVLFQVLFGGAWAQVPGVHVLLDLPQVPLPDWAAGLTLLGPVTSQAVLSGLYDGMRLAAVLICVGAANTLANPRRLLAGLPPALYELGTAVVIALSVFPQLAESVQRVHRARRLRGDPGRGVGALRRVVVPVLEDALERSLALAASMDARGYGRVGDRTPAERCRTGALLIGALLGLCVGSYGLLDATAPRVIAWPMLTVGLVLAGSGLRAAGRGVRRSRYRPDRWHTLDRLTAASGFAAAALMVRVGAIRPDVTIADPALVPVLTVTALLAVLLGLLPTVLPTVLPALLPAVSSVMGGRLPRVAARDAAAAPSTSRAPEVPVAGRQVVPR